MEFCDGAYYHVYNRGVEKRDIFLDKHDYMRFLRGMREFNSTEPVGSLYQKDLITRTAGKGFENPMGCSKPSRPQVEIISYCLMPNHYHFLMKQSVDSGISEFMKKLGGGYTNYFNYKNNRSGVLFQGGYKAIEVKNYSHFLKLAVYVNCNYEIHKMGKSENWIWSSYLDYIGTRKGSLCNKDAILKEFYNKEDYKFFCQSTIKDIQEFKEARL